MEQITPTPPASQADTPIDVSEYENLATRGYQDKEDISPDTEKKIEFLLLKVIFVTKIISLVTFIAIFCFVGYSWSRNQTQNSWIMRQTAYVYQGSPVCNWVNSGNNRKIDTSTEFLAFLERNPRKDLNLDLKQLLEDNICLTPDTMSHLLGMEEKYMTEKLREVYETTLIKKFLGSTMESSAEIDTILSLDPENRLKHIEVLSLVAEKIKEGTVKGRNTITCSNAKFQGLTTDFSCTVESVPPIQPRDEAIKFLESLEKTDKLLVDYPNSLDLKVDTRGNLLSTSFGVSLIYAPARYEGDFLKKI